MLSGRWRITAAYRKMCSCLAARDDMYFGLIAHQADTVKLKEVV